MQIRKGQILWYGSVKKKDNLSLAQTRKSPGALGYYFGLSPLISLGILTEKGEETGYLHKCLVTSDLVIEPSKLGFAEILFLSEPTEVGHGVEEHSCYWDHSRLLTKVQDWGTEVILDNSQIQRLDIVDAFEVNIQVIRKTVKMYDSIDLRAEQEIIATLNIDLSN